MKAIVINAPEDIMYIEVEKPKPGPKEVLTKVSYCGICGTDLDILYGNTSLAKNGLIRYPVRIGHEWSGIVEEVGKDVKDFKPGDRVVSDNGSTCGKCSYCLEGNYKQCKNGRALGTVNNHKEGAFAEYMLMPYWHMYKLPDNIGLDEAALFEPASIALNGINHCRINSKSTVLVVGTGAIGMAAVGFAKYKGAERVLLAGRKDYKLEIGRKMGADAIVNVTRESLKDFVMKETGNAGVDVFFETSGSGSYVKQSIEMTPYNGIVALIGFYENNINDLDINRLVLGHIQMQGCDGSGWTVPDVIEIVSKGYLSLKPIITHIYPFGEAIDAIQSARINNNEKIKILIEFAKEEVV